MKHQRKIVGNVADPALPKTPITIKGKTYDLCLDLGALAEAELHINRELARAGATEPVNLLMALPIANLFNTRIVFAAALRTFHPEVSFETAKGLVTFDSVWDVATAIRQAWTQCTPEQEASPDPSQPGA